METFRNGPLEFVVHDAGPSDGDVVVLLHGYPQDSSSWDAVAPRLHTAGLRTLAPDLRGYSPGARPPGRRNYTVDLLAGDVIALLDAAGLDRAHVVGHDWGGGVAWATAMLHPDRVTTLTALATPHPAAMGWARRHSTQALQSWYMVAFQVPWLPEHLFSRTLARTLRGSGLDRASAERYGRRFADPASLTGPINYYRALPLTARFPAERLHVTVPTTYVWGTHDQFLGRAAAERTGAYVDADYRFQVVETGHWLPEACPDIVAGAILHRVGA